MAATTFTASVNGTHGTHNVTVALECPTEKQLRSLGQYQLGAYATRYPLAAQVLAEKTTAKPSTGNEPEAVDTAKATTLTTATDAQLIAELLSRHTTVKSLEDVALAFDAALLEAENELEADKPVPVAPKQDVVKADIRKATGRESVAAQMAKQDGAKLTDAPKWTDATLPKSHKAVVSLGKDRLASLATWLGVGTDGMNFANAAGAVWSALKAAEPAKPAPKAKAKAKPADTAKPAPADPIVPGVFDAAGKPLTLSQVKAALEAYTATAAKKAA